MTNVVSLSCPYCNASVTVSPGTAAGQRVSCPRCGDAFTVREPVAGEAGIRQVPSLPPPDLAGLSLPPRRSNARVAALVLAGMGCMAAVGLGFALVSQEERRAHDAGIPKKARRAPQPEPEEPLPAVAAPDKLEALGFLPADTDVILGVHAAELGATPAGMRLLQEPIQVGRTEINVAGWAKGMGLGLEDVDHLVLGLNAEAVLPPQFYVVWRTREPFDPEKLRSRLNGQRVAGPNKKGVFRFSVPGLPLPFAMSCPDNRTAVVALLDTQLEAVPATPVADLAKLRPELRTVLRERREPGSLLWVAGHVENWNKTALRKVIDKMPKEDRERLTQVRTFGVWVQLEGGVTVKASFHCQDAAKARALDDRFRAPERAKLNLKTAADGPWVSVQFRTDLAAVQHALGP
jgi:hypothetical protein